MYLHPCMQCSPSYPGRTQPQEIIISTDAPTEARVTLCTSAMVSLPFLLSMADRAKAMSVETPMKVWRMALCHSSPFRVNAELKEGQNTQRNKVPMRGRMSYR